MFECVIASVVFGWKSGVSSLSFEIIAATDLSELRPEVSACAQAASKAPGPWASSRLPNFSLMTSFWSAVLAFRIKPFDSTLMLGPAWSASWLVVDLTPEAPFLLTRVCEFRFHILHHQFGQVRPARSSQMWTNQRWPTLKRVDCQL